MITEQKLISDIKETLNAADKGYIPNHVAISGVRQMIKNYDNQPTEKALTTPSELG